MTIKTTFEDARVVITWDGPLGAHPNIEARVRQLAGSYHRLARLGIRGGMLDSPEVRAYRERAKLLEATADDVTNRTTWGTHDGRCACFVSLHPIALRQANIEYYSRGSGSYTGD